MLVAMGKASVAMAQAAVDQIGKQLQRGICVCKAFPEPLPDWKNIQLIRGSHPLPDERSMRAGKAIRACVGGLSANDLVLVMISGGASALVVSPVEGISLDDLQQANQLLLLSGATINEMNAVRKHLEQLKGGGLLRAVSPGKVEALLLSDVIGDDSSVIASGPTVADPTTYAQVLETLEKYQLNEKLPKAVLAHFRAGVSGKAAETVKPGNELLGNVHNHIIGSNSLSVDAALAEATNQGLRGVCVSRGMVGEANEVAGWFLDRCVKLAAENTDPFMAVAGGETTVIVHGKGKGGRNLELALAGVRRLSADEKGVLLTLATDGEDGPTDAAGAIVTADTMKRAQRLGLDPDQFLQNNDAYTFFERVGGLIQTGPTGTNVNDLTFYFRLP